MAFLARRGYDWREAVLVTKFLVLVALLIAFSSVADAQVRIPETSALYRLQVEREAARYFGIEASPARLAGQLHQESGWRPDAQSPYAQGLAQFTPATAKWLPDVCPEVGAPDPWNPSWSIRAAACYDAWLLRRVRPHAGPQVGPLSECSLWAFALRYYNGGAGWTERERRLAATNGAGPNDWQAVEPHRARAFWAHKENTGYPRRILLRLEPAYLAAGWSGQAVCP